MKEYSKEQLVQDFGKPIWGNSICNVGYLSGIDVFDLKMDEKKGKAMKYPAFFYKFPNGFSIEILLGFSKFRTGIHIDKIKYLVIEHQEQIINQKNKSVVGRALVGGLLLGPLGAVVGGMTGIGSTAAKMSDYPDNVLTICAECDEKEIYILFSVKNEDFKDVEKSLKSSFPDKYKSFQEVMKEEPSIVVERFSVADEIRKLKELLDSGALTQAEFDEQKLKVLNRE